MPPDQPANLEADDACQPDGIIPHLVHDLRVRAIDDDLAGRERLARTRADLADALTDLCPDPPPTPPDPDPWESLAMIFTRAYWAAALERAISAGAAAATAGLTLDSMTGYDITAWRTVGISFGVGAVFSVVKGLAANVTNGGLGPGLGSVEVTPPAIVLPSEDGEARGTGDMTPAEVVIADPATTLSPGEAATTAAQPPAPDFARKFGPTDSSQLPSTLMVHDVDGRDLEVEEEQP